MGRAALLTPYSDTQRQTWVISIPPALSATGKRKRESFPTKRAAQTRADELKAISTAGHRLARAASPDLIRCAVNYDELFRTVWGIQGGLQEACESYLVHLGQTATGRTVGDLIEAYEKTRSPSWSDKYKANWKWFRGLMAPLEEVPVAMADSDYWQAWLDEKARASAWKDYTFNNVAAMLSAVWNAALKKGEVERNPITGVHRPRIRRENKAVFTVAEVRSLLDAAWHHDRELVPYFAIAIFAGLRPDEKSELAVLDWRDVDFDGGFIRVAANFDNKTGTKRHVPIEGNLRLWLEPWKGSQGAVVPQNLRTRRRWLTRGKYQSPAGTPESEWKQLVPFGSDVRDITRHTYGSYLEAKYRDRNVVQANMGHTNFATYEQHYRNARSPQEGEEFWRIVPPEQS